MRLVDARRLTGPSHLARVPLVLVEVALDPGEEVAAARNAYCAELARMRVALGLEGSVSVITRAHRGGAVFAYEAPIDIMLACAEMSEWAGESASEVLSGRPPLALEPRHSELEATLATERRPMLVALAAEASRRGIALLLDDAGVTLGTGARSVSYAEGFVPDPAQVSWEALGAIPVALVTGTNGKTTSSRLLARVASEAGLRVGATSSGGITVGGKLIEDGDWTGPGAARIVLRRSDVELAVLETARGGVLRRGLGVTTCDVALLTNVSDDHIGLYGIDDVAAMTEVKGVVAHAVKPGGTAALNAADANLVALARELACEVTFFADLDGAPGPSLEAASAVITAHRALGKKVVFAQGGEIVTAHGADVTTLLAVTEVPITFGGGARYNVENALGVVAAAQGLGLATEAIVRGLRGFDMRDNPGRGQIVDVAGVTVLLDFGHNPDGVRAVMKLVASLRAAPGAAPAGKLTIITGSPGDRSDQEITDVARVLQASRPDRVLVRELAGYERGREIGDVPALYRRVLIEHGLPEEAFAIAASEVDALERALEGARAGDFIALLVHLDEAPVRALLAAREAAAQA